MADTYATPGSGPKEPGPKQGRAIALDPTEHYVMAEGLLEELLNSEDDFANSAEIANVLAVAQVHATLATVDPNRLWPRKFVTARDGDQTFTYDRLGRRVEPEPE